MPEADTFSFRVEEIDRGRRLDSLVSSKIPDCSRSRAADLIQKGDIRVDHLVRKPGFRVKSGSTVSGRIPPPKSLELRPEPVLFDILYEDSDLIIINKPPGLVVHPAPGHTGGTLVNGLLYRIPDLGGIGGNLRPGIVHRLDKDTSGILVVAKNDRSHQYLSSLFKSRKVLKTYLAIVWGKPAEDQGLIELPIGRHPADRKRMSVKSRKSRSARTYWRMKENFGPVSLLEMDLLTGRTHQLRVHCSAVGHPIVGDPVYGPKKPEKRLTRSDKTDSRLLSVKRQQLHAWRLQFAHPASDQMIDIQAPIPPDIADLIEALRKKKSK